MKKITSISMALAIASLLAVDVAYFTSNSAVLSHLNASTSSGSDPSDSSSSSSASSGSGSNLQMQRETQIGQSLYVISVVGEASGQVTLGMRLSNSLAAELKGQVVAELRDEYCIICYPKGHCPCTSTDWHMCASSGCPVPGIQKDC